MSMDRTHHMKVTQSTSRSKEEKVLSSTSKVDGVSIDIEVEGLSNENDDECFSDEIGSNTHGSDLEKEVRRILSEHPALFEMLGDE